jgi:hypothetical protein
VYLWEALPKTASNFKLNFNFNIVPHPYLHPLEEVHPGKTVLGTLKIL